MFGAPWRWLTFSPSKPGLLLLYHKIHKHYDTWNTRMDVRGAQTAGINEIRGLYTGRGWLLEWVARVGIQDLFVYIYIICYKDDQMYTDILYLNSYSEVLSVTYLRRWRWPARRFQTVLCTYVYTNRASYHMQCVSYSRIEPHTPCQRISVPWMPSTLRSSSEHGCFYNLTPWTIRNITETKWIRMCVYERYIWKKGSSYQLNRDFYALFRWNGEKCINTNQRAWDGGSPWHLLFLHSFQFVAVFVSIY